MTRAKALPGSSLARCAPHPATPVCSRPLIGPGWSTTTTERSGARRGAARRATADQTPARRRRAYDAPTGASACNRIAAARGHEGIRARPKCSGRARSRRRAADERLDAGAQCVRSAPDRRNSSRACTPAEHRRLSEATTEHAETLSAEPARARCATLKASTSPCTRASSQRVGARAPAEPSRKGAHDALPRELLTSQGPKTPPHHRGSVDMAPSAIRHPPSSSSASQQRRAATTRIPRSTPSRSVDDLLHEVFSGGRSPKNSRACEPPTACSAAIRGSAKRSNTPAIATFTAEDAGSAAPARPSRLSQSVQYFPSSIAGAPRPRQLAPPRAATARTCGVLAVPSRPDVETSESSKTCTTGARSSNRDTYNQPSAPENEAPRASRPSAFRGCEMISTSTARPDVRVRERDQTVAVLVVGP